MLIQKLSLGLLIYFMLSLAWSAPVYRYQIVKQYTHSPKAFTQGLYLDEPSRLYESAGLYYQSKIIVYDLASNKVIKRKALPAHLFAEGLTILNNKIYLGLFQAKNILIFDKNTLQKMGEVTSPVAVWGLTTDGKQLIMSDGSSKITFFDPLTQRVGSTITVKDDHREIKDINALQYQDGKIYANIWHTELIATIDATSGKVLVWINLAGINPNPNLLKGELVLNGVAYHRARDTLLVTGKFWPKIYEINIIKTVRGQQDANNRDNP